MTTCSRRAVASEHTIKYIIHLLAHAEIVDFVPVEVSEVFAHKVLALLQTLLQRRVGLLMIQITIRIAMVTNCNTKKIQISQGLRTSVGWTELRPDIVHW